MVNASMMLGAILMFGIILPVANKHNGDWYPPKSTWSNSKDVRGTYAYQVFTALGMFLGQLLSALHHHVFLISFCLLLHSFLDQVFLCFQQKST